MFERDGEKVTEREIERDIERQTHRQTERHRRGEVVRDHHFSFCKLGSNIQRFVILLLQPWFHLPSSRRLFKSTSIASQTWAIVLVVTLAAKLYHVKTVS